MDWPTALVHLLSAEEETMSHYPYLIIGGGMTAAGAIQGIREVDPRGAIGLIGGEPYLPYQRPPLSKALWKGKPLERVWIAMESAGTDFHLGRMAQALDPEHKRVVDDQGSVYTSIGCSWRWRHSAALALGR
jgi:NAD(P)H-nitrite reductase large subunit